MDWDKTEERLVSMLNAGRHNFDGFTMGLRPIFEPNGWENGFTEGHFGGEISPISLTDFR